MRGLTGAWNIPADQDQDELSDPNQADLRVFDGFNPRDRCSVPPGDRRDDRPRDAAGGMSSRAVRIFRTDGTTLRARLPAGRGDFVNLGEVPKET